MRTIVLSKGSFSDYLSLKVVYSAAGPLVIFFFKSEWFCLNFDQNHYRG